MTRGAKNLARQKQRETKRGCQADGPTKKFTPFDGSCAHVIPKISVGPFDLRIREIRWISKPNDLAAAGYISDFSPSPCAGKRSADFQSAVSPICNRQACEQKSQPKLPIHSRS